MERKPAPEHGPLEATVATEEQRAAARIRDHVLPLVRAGGQVRPVGPTSQVMWEAGAFRFALRTPSSPRTPAADAPEFAAAEAAAEAGRMLPFGLDIWHHDRVLSLQWDADRLEVTSFRRGPWEDEVLALR
jgi:hypothetical protein